MKKKAKGKGKPAAKPGDKGGKNAMAAMMKKKGGGY
jgi:hypothetical protein